MADGERIKLDPKTDYLKRVKNFADFLGKKNEVNIDSTGSEITRPGLKAGFEDHTGVSTNVYVDQKKVGVLEFYENPTAYVFEGKIPHGKKRLKDKDVHVNWSVDNGRGDGLKEIPFP